MKHANSKIFVSLLGLLILCFSSNLSAQTERGTQFVGGDLDTDFNSFQNASNVNVTLQLGVQYGCFVKDGLAVGLRLPIEYYSGSLVPEDIWRVSGVLSPFILWYPGKQTKNIKFFLLGETGIHLTREASIFLGLQLVDPFREGSIDWVSGAGMGINAFVTPNVALTGTLKSNYGVKLSGDAFTDYSRVNLSFGVQVFLPTK